MAELWEKLFKDALGPNKIKFKLNIVSMDDMTPEEEAAFFENLDTASNYLGFAYQDKDDPDTILYQLLTDKNKDKEINFNLKSFRDYLVNQFQNDLAKPEWYDKLINTGGEMEILDLTDSKTFQNFFSLPSNTTIAQTKEQGTINTKTVNFPKIEENGVWKGNANQIIGIVSTCLLQVQNIDAKTKEEFFTYIAQTLEKDLYQSFYRIPLTTIQKYLVLMMLIVIILIIYNFLIFKIIYYLC